MWNRCAAHVILVSHFDLTHRWMRKTCDIGNGCSWEGQICSENGLVGSCKMSCLSAFGGVALSDSVCNGELDSKTIDELQRRFCEATGQGENCAAKNVERCDEVLQMLPPGAQLPPNFREQCLLGSVGVRRQMRCVRQDVACDSNSSSFCIENNLIGECRDGDDGVFCYDRSDECPVDMECELPARPVIEGPFPAKPFPGPFSAMSEDSEEEGKDVADRVRLQRVGRCDAEYRCAARRQPCERAEQMQVRRFLWGGGGAADD